MRRRDTAEALEYFDDEDTEVTDVPELPPVISIARARVPTGDLAVHVLVEGAYHRRSPDISTTSCGLTIHAQFCPVRREELVHPLSRDCGCFTSYEIAKADAADAARRKAEDEWEPP